MKKILFILITIPLIFGSCEKEDDSPNSNSNNGNPLTPSLGLIGYGSDGNNVYKTTNGGVDWTNVSYDNIGKLHFISENIGYGSDGNNVYKTTNGGVDWTNVSYDNIGEISFL